MNRTVPLLAVLVTASTLAGCITADSTVDARPVDARPVPMYDLVEVSIVANAHETGNKDGWFTIDATSFEVPATLRITNDDIVRHGLTATYTSLGDQTPVWAKDHHDEDDESDGHGHDAVEEGGHQHHLPPSEDGIFSLDLMPGEQVDVNIKEDGILAVRCDPHPWMTAEWDATPSKKTSYYVSVNDLILEGSTTGETRMGHGGENVVTQPILVTAPNLVSMQAVLEWDDSPDDGPGGKGANEPDTFRVSLIDPAGDVVAEDTLEARKGTIDIDFRARDQDWPGTVEARSEMEARGALMAAQPDVVTRIGNWTVQVELLAAPGYLPGDMDDGGSAHDAPEGQGFDGHQGWTLTVREVHQWGSIGPNSKEVTMELHLAGSTEHEH